MTQGFSICLLVSLATGTLFAQSHPPSPSPAAALEGAWKETEGDRLCHIQGDQVVTFSGGKQVVMGLERHQSDGLLVLRNEGKLETWHASVRNELLELGKEGDVRTYRKLASLPPELTLQPFLLGDFRPLPPDQIRRIQREVERRWRLDQAVRIDPAKKILEPQVDADNRAYMFYLLREVGWLDVARFGVRTSVFATLFVKHFFYLPLNLAILPYVARDLRMTGEGQVFAILFDDTLLHLGHKQRYGTQIDEDAQGNPYLLPLEEPDRVDEFLNEIGESPVSAYLKEASRVLYDGKPIRMARPDE